MNFVFFFFFVSLSKPILSSHMLLHFLNNFCARLILMCSFYFVWCTPISQKHQKFIVDSCQPFVHNSLDFVAIQFFFSCVERRKNEIHLVPVAQLLHIEIVTLIFLHNHFISEYKLITNCLQRNIHFNCRRKYNTDCLSKKKMNHNHHRRCLRRRRRHCYY